MPIPPTGCVHAAPLSFSGGVMTALVNRSCALTVAARDTFTIHFIAYLNGTAVALFHPH